MEATKRRSPHRRTAFANRKITSRDLEIVAAVHRHRLLNTEHVKALFGSDHVRKRLTFLNHNGYLDWPEAQRALHYDGMKHSIYALSDQGADLLDLSDRRDFSERNQALKPWSLPHMLLVSDVLVSLESACGNSLDVTYLDPERVALRSRAADHDPKKITAPVDQDGTLRKVNLKPDAIVALEVANHAKLLFIEADRATERSTNPSGSSVSNIYDKFRVYQSYARRKGHQKQFGVDNFRVLFLTSAGQGRILSMFEALKAAGAEGSGRYLFGLREQLEHDNILDMRWINGNGEVVRLVEQPTLGL